MNKSLLFLPLVFLLGCASKPKPRSGITVSDIYWISGCPVGFATDINFETGAYSCDGSISHATREQWEAAQGLYNFYVGRCTKEHRYPCREVITKVGTRQDFDISLPPGDAK